MNKALVYTRYLEGLNSGLNYTPRFGTLFLALLNVDWSYCRVCTDFSVVAHIHLMYCCYSCLAASVKMNHNMSLLVLRKKRKEDSCSSCYC